MNRWCVCMLYVLTLSSVYGSCSLSLSSMSFIALRRREISTLSRALCSSSLISSLRSSVFSFTCSSFSSWYRTWWSSLNCASILCFRSAVWSWIQRSRLCAADHFLLYWLCNVTKAQLVKHCVVLICNVTYALMKRGGVAYVNSFLLLVNIQ